jgi:hypothetical protein
MSKIEVDAIDKQSGSTLTLGGSGTAVTLACGATQTGFGRTGTVDWNTTVKTGDFTAVSGDGYFVNSAGGTITVTLPSSPTANSIVSVSDYNGSAGTNAITIGRNSSKINGDAVDYSINKSNSAVTFVYVDATAGWTSVQTSNITDNFNPFIVASGGTVTCCGDFKIHTFTGPGTFTVSNAGAASGSNTVDYLVIGGGGGSGSAAGGAGAGGYRFSNGTASGCYSAGPGPLGASALPVSVQGYPIVVGGGGAGGAAGADNSGANGVNSVFSTITSTGGGGGGAYDTAAGNGGSGGGVAPSSCGTTGGTGNTPPVSPPQGNNGGNHTAPTPSPYYAGTGGGGASAAGVSTGCASVASAGGDGLASSITGAAVTRAGGGGGSALRSPPGTVGGTAGAGGAGGGGAGKNGSSPPYVGNPGTINTGSGAGAGSAGCFSGGGRGGGGAGGSGLIVIRYKYQ